LHDKDRKPVRVAKKKQAQQEGTGEDDSGRTVCFTASLLLEPGGCRRQVVIVREFSGIDPLILVLIVLLFLWLILGMNRRKEGTEAALRNDHGDVLDGCAYHERS